MWLRAFSLLIALLLPSSGHAAEALALKVLGFSPDGRQFGFIQYGGVGDGGEYEAEAIVIDVDRDRLVRPPLLIASYLEETPHTDERPYDEWLLAYAEKRFAGELRKYRFQPAGWPIAADEGAQARQSFALSSDRTLSLGSDALEFVHERLGRVRVALQNKR